VVFDAGYPAVNFGCFCGFVLVKCVQRFSLRSQFGEVFLMALAAGYYFWGICASCFVF